MVHTLNLNTLMVVAEDSLSYILALRPVYFEILSQNNKENVIKLLIRYQALEGVLSQMALSI